MDSQRLAERLLAAKTKRQRKRLLAENSVSVGVDLARYFKDVCVENWAAKPKLTQNAARVLNELASEFPYVEIAAYAAWASGIAEMTYGRLEKAVENLDAATANFVKAGRTFESAQPQIAALVALAMLGQYDRIPAVGRRALRILEKYGDQLSAGKVEINLTNIAFQLGRYRQAEKLGLSALGRFKRLKAAAWQAMVENGLANTYAALNDFRSAEKYFRAALRSARSTGKLVTEAEIEASIGNLALSRGRYAEALQFFERSRQKFDELKMPHKSAIADLEIAEIYSELNLSGEAMELLTRIVGKLAKLKMQSEEARARLVLGKTAIRQKKVSLARKQLERASRLYELEKNQTKKAVVTIHQALLELDMGNFAAARQFAKKAEAVFKKTENERERLMSSWIMGDVMARTGKVERGVADLRQTLADALRFEQSQVALLALNSIGRAQSETGNLRAAEKAFRQAVALTESSRAPLPGEEFRIAFLEGKLEPFEQLAKIALAENRVEDALGFVESARSRSLLETMGDGPATAKLSNGYSSEASRLREELNWFYSKSGDAAAENPVKLQSEIKRLERRLSDLLRREQSLGKTASAKRRVQRSVFDIERVRKALGSDKALIEYVKLDGKLSAFVLTSKGAHFAAGLSTENAVTEELEQLRFQFGTFRYGRDAVSGFAEQLKQRADSALARLYEMLVSPLEPIIGDHDLVIVPSGVVHYVPFSALRNSSGYLIQTRNVSAAPSASIWEALTLRPASRMKKPMLMAFADDAAPEVENEAKAIAGILPRACVFAGNNATFSNFRENAAGHDLIHLACHGKFRADSPLYSNLQLADGLINVRDISSQKLNVGLVVLSACETGLNKLFPGEEIIGLARGFISAGVKSLVLSLWTVNDEATKRFMVEFYASLQRGNSVEASLRQTQTGFIEKGEHPYYWSPFFSIG